MSKRGAKAASLVKTLTEAKQKISEPSRWCKYELFDISGRCCAVGAIYKTTGENLNAYHNAVDALEKGLPGIYDHVPSYNDRNGTKHADIMALYDRAIEKQCEIVRKEAEQESKS